MQIGRGLKGIAAVTLESGARILAHRESRLETVKTPNSVRRDSMSERKVYCFGGAARHFGALVLIGGICLVPYRRSFAADAWVASLLRWLTSLNGISA